MPFADVRCLIACFVKIMSKRRNVARKRNTVPITSALSSVNTRLQTRSCRTAYRLTGKVVFKLYTFTCKLAKVWRYFFINRVPTLLVRKIEMMFFCFIISSLKAILSYKSCNRIVKINNRNRSNNCRKDSLNYFFVAFFIHFSA